MRQRRSSVPVALAGRRVLARVGARAITIVADGRVVARHERLAERFAVSARFDHYLELLALERSPACFACIRSASAAPGLSQQIAVKVGASEAARQMVDAPMVVRDQGAGARRVGRSWCAGRRCPRRPRRGGAVAKAQRRPPAAPLDLDARLAGPAPDLTACDRLLN